MKKYILLVALLFLLPACDSGLQPLDDDDNVVIVDPDPDDDPVEEQNWIIRTPGKWTMHLNADWNVTRASSAQVQGHFIGWEDSQEFAAVQQTENGWVYEWDLQGDVPVNTLAGFTWKVGDKYAMWGVEPNLLSESERRKTCVSDSGQDVLLFYKVDAEGNITFPGCPAGWQHL